MGNMGAGEEEQECGDAWGLIDQGTHTAERNCVCVPGLPGVNVIGRALASPTGP